MQATQYNDKLKIMQFPVLAVKRHAVYSAPHINFHVSKLLPLNPLFSGFHEL